MREEIAALREQNEFGKLQIDINLHSEQIKALQEACLQLKSHSATLSSALNERLEQLEARQDDIKAELSSEIQSLAGEVEDIRQESKPSHSVENRIESIYSSLSQIQGELKTYASR